MPLKVSAVAELLVGGENYMSPAGEIDQLDVDRVSKCQSFSYHGGGRVFAGRN
jgi:hypothetical protein